mgnify:CR=1 FL=1
MIFPGLDSDVAHGARTGGWRPRAARGFDALLTAARERPGAESPNTSPEAASLSAAVPLDPGAMLRFAAIVDARRKGARRSPSDKSR